MKAQRKCDRIIIFVSIFLNLYLYTYRYLYLFIYLYIINNWKDFYYKYTPKYFFLGVHYYIIYIGGKVFFIFSFVKGNESCAIARNPILMNGR